MRVRGRATYFSKVGVAHDEKTNVYWVIDSCASFAYGRVNFLHSMRSNGPANSF